MSLETITYSEELERLDKARETLLNNVAEFMKFIKSDKVFDDDMTFDEKLMEIQKSVTVIAELTVEPSLMLERFKQALAGQQPQQPQQQLTLTEVTSEKAFTMPKAIVATVSVLGSAVLVEQGLLPPITIPAVVGGVLVFAFASQLKELITAFLTKRGKEEEKLTLEDIEKISGIFSQIRGKYVSAYFLIRWQGAPGEPIPDQFKNLGIDKALINRGEYLRKTILHEFSDKIGQIINACERSIWQRKQLVISAMAQSAAMRGRM